jgi:hypothetical protein
MATHLAIGKTACSINSLSGLLCFRLSHESPA